MTAPGSFADQEPQAAAVGDVVGAGSAPMGSAVPPRPVSARAAPWHLSGYERSCPPPHPMGQSWATTRQPPMTALEYGDYTPDRNGWFFGMSGLGLALVLVAALPGLAAMNGGRWLVLAVWAPAWALLVGLAAVPVRGRSATGWAIALVLHGLGGVMGWTRWQSRAAAGIAADLGETDLPGVLAGIQIHDGPPPVSYTHLRAHETRHDLVC